MENLGVIAWFQSHYADLGMIVLYLYLVAEVVTRLTPTEKDDAFLQRVGGVVKKVLDFLRIPNNLK